MEFRLLMEKFLSIVALRRLRIFKSSLRYPSAIVPKSCEIVVGPEFLPMKTPFIIHTPRASRRRIGNQKNHKQEGTDGRKRQVSGVYRRCIFSLRYDRAS